MNIPLAALSLLSMMGCLPTTFPFPLSLTAAPASPRLLVNTFKHTLRAGISKSTLFCFFSFVECLRYWQYTEILEGRLGI
jgi:hypothetical protein